MKKSDKEPKKFRMALQAVTEVFYYVSVETLEHPKKKNYVLSRIEINLN